MIEDILKIYLPETLLTVFLLINIFFMISRGKKGYYFFLIFSYLFLIIADIISSAEGFIFLIDIGSFFILYTFYLNERKEDFCTQNLFIFAHLISLHLILKTNSLLIFFISLELLSFVFYILIGLETKEFKDIAPLVRYFVIGSLSSIILLFSIVLIYTRTQDLSYDAFVMFNKIDPVFRLSIFLFIFALGFKILFIPFQFFMPDVFEKIRIHYLVLISLTPKAGILIFLYKIKFYLPEILFPISVFAIITLFFSNLAGIYDKKIKRVLAYSTISHSSFLLFSILLSEPYAKNVLFYYLLIYFIMKGGIFLSLNYFFDKNEDLEFKELKGLYFTDKIIAVSALLFILSLASFPPTGGFFAKFYLLYELFKSGFVKEVFILLILTVLGFGYYIKFLNSFFLEPAKIRKVKYEKFYKYFTLILGIISLFSFIFIKFFI